MYCVSLQLVRQCNSQRVFPCTREADSSVSSWKREKCFVGPLDLFSRRAKSLNKLGLLALLFSVFFINNIRKEEV